MVHTCDPSSGGAGTREAQGQPGLAGETLSQKRKGH